MIQQDNFNARMSVRSALGVLADIRDDSTIVVTNQGSARVWPLIDEHVLDFHYNPSTMGGAIPFGLGLALANSSLHVIVVSGDGALTMNLGSLITVVAAGADNLTVVVLDNGIYEVTGGQRTAASVASVDYVALADSVGFPSSCGFGAESLWRDQAATVMSAVGPRFVSLCVEPALSADMTTSAPPIAKQLVQLSRVITNLR